MSNDYAFFYNSENGDRKYNADSLSTWLRKFFTTGVFEGDLFVESKGGMDVKIGTGYVNIEGKVRFFESPATFTIQPADGTFPRIDAIAVEKNDIERNVTLKYIKGTYSGTTPTAPTPIRTNSVYQLFLAKILVNAGATSLTQAVITDTRTDKSLCGYVVGTVEQIDFEQISAQLKKALELDEQAFLEWFDEMKDQLSEDAAGNLQLQINTKQNVITHGTELPDAEYGNDGDVYIQCY